MAANGRQIRRVLVSVALSPRAESLIGEGVSICERLGAEAVFLHCGEDTPEARGKLTGLLGAFVDDPDARLRFRSGDPAEAICATAKDEGIDLIVAGALEKEGWVESIWGSVARRIARHAACSVMLLPSPRREGSSFRSLAAAVDTDAYTARAMGVTLDIARGTQAEELHFLSERSGYLGWLHSHYTGGRSAEDDSSETSRTEERYRLASFLAQYDLDDYTVTLAQLEGGRGAAIARYVRENHIELLVVVAPPRPLTFWDRFFHHAAEGVMEDIPCAFVVARPRA